MDSLYYLLGQNRIVLLVPGSISGELVHIKMQNTKIQNKYKKSRKFVEMNIRWQKMNKCMCLAVIRET
jgi:hypothetical protein